MSKKKAPTAEETAKTAQEAASVATTLHKLINGVVELVLDPKVKWTSPEEKLELRRVGTMDRMIIDGQIGYVLQQFNAAGILGQEQSDITIGLTKMMLDVQASMHVRLAGGVVRRRFKDLEELQKTLPIPELIEYSKLIKQHFDVTDMEKKS